MSALSRWLLIPPVSARLSEAIRVTAATARRRLAQRSAACG